MNPFLSAVSPYTSKPGCAFCGVGFFSPAPVDAGAVYIQRADPYVSCRQPEAKQMLSVLPAERSRLAYWGKLQNAQKRRTEQGEDTQAFQSGCRASPAAILRPSAAGWAANENGRDFMAVFSPRQIPFAGRRSASWCEWSRRRRKSSGRPPQAVKNRFRSHPAASAESE